MLLAGFLVFLLIPVLTGCKKTTPETSAAPSIGILDLEKVTRAHSRYSEIQKFDQEIARVKAEATQSANTISSKLPAGAERADIAGQTNAGYQQALNQQIDAQMASKRKELEQTLDAKVSAAKKSLNQQLADYAKELDKTYQPSILSLQLKLQTLQMTQEERDAIKSQIDALQEQRTQKLRQQQELLEQDFRPKIEQEQKNAEEQLRQFHAKLLEEANSQMLEQRKAIETRPTETASGMTVPDGKQKNAAELQILLEQREKLWQIIMKDVKDVTARIAAKEKLEVVIVKYQQNVQAIDITEAVMAEIKK